MKQFINGILIVAISGGLFVGCKTSSPKPQPPSVAESPSSTEQADEALDDNDLMGENHYSSKGNAESLAHFAAGISQALNDKNDEALDHFYQAAVSDPANESLVMEVSRDLLAKKETKKAIDLLAKSAARPNASAPLLSWLGQAYFQDGRTNEAISSARSAIAKAPSSLDGYQSLCLIQLKTGQHAEALVTLNRASKKIQPAPEALLDLAELYGAYLKARPDDEKLAKPQGLKVLDRVASQKEQTDRLKARLAQAYEHLGEPSKAAEVYLKLLATETKSPARRDALREKLANLFLVTDDKKRAMEQLQSLVRDNPTRYPQAWFVLGTIAGDTKDYESAANNFERALLLDPDMEQAYYELALAQIDLKKNGQALRTLDKAREKFPNTFIGEFFTGVAYSRMKDYGEAMKHLTAAEVIAQAKEPRRLTQQFYFQIGAAAERSHQLERAIEYFEKALKIAPDFHEAMNYLGYMWAERGENLPRARELIEKAVKAEPKNAAYLDSMGWVLFKLNQPREALPWLLKAQEHSPEPDATLLDHIADTYMALQQPEKAREAWKKSLSIEPNEVVQKKLDALPHGGS